MIFLFHVSSIEVSLWYSAGSWAGLKGPVLFYYLPCAFLGVVLRLGSVVAVHQSIYPVCQPQCGQASYVVSQALTTNVLVNKQKAALSLMTTEVT